MTLIDVAGNLCPEEITETTEPVLFDHGIKELGGQSGHQTSANDETIGDTNIRIQASAVARTESNAIGGNLS